VLFIINYIDMIIGRNMMKGICKECKVRDNDTTEKEIILCHLCDEYFCDYHISPKTAVLSPTDFRRMMKDEDYIKIIKKGKLFPLMQADLERNDGHPCIPYTRYKWDEAGLEAKRLYEALEKIDASYKDKKKEVTSQKEDEKNIPTLESTYKDTNLKNILLVFLIMVIIFVILLFLLVTRT